jgi:hypothetical protein
VAPPPLEAYRAGQNTYDRLAAAGKAPTPAVAEKRVTAAAELERLQLAAARQQGLALVDEWLRAVRKAQALAESMAEQAQTVPSKGLAVKALLQTAQVAEQHAVRAAELIEKLSGSAAAQAPVVFLPERLSADQWLATYLPDQEAELQRCEEHAAALRASRAAHLAAAAEAKKATKKRGRGA